MSSNESAIDLYWRPGCPFCMRLDRALEPTGIPVKRHNIWESDKAAAYVRSVANGNETVPTVTVGSKSMVNPSLGDIIAAMSAETPHLLPDDVEVPQGNRLGRAIGKLLS